MESTEDHHIYSSSDKNGMNKTGERPVEEHKAPSVSRDRSLFLSQRPPSIARSVGSGTDNERSLEVLTPASLARHNEAFSASLSGSGLIHAGETVQTWETLALPSKRQPGRPVRREVGMKRGAPFYLGLAHVALGLCAVAFQCGAIGVYAELSYVSQGIWAGLLFVSFGIVAVTSTKWENDCLARSTLFLAITSFLAAITGLIISIVALSRESDIYFQYYQGSARMFVTSLLVVIFLVEAVMCIWSLCLLSRTDGTQRPQSTGSSVENVVTCSRLCCCFCYKPPNLLQGGHMNAKDKAHQPS